MFNVGKYRYRIFILQKVNIIKLTIFIPNMNGIA